MRLFRRQDGRYYAICSPTRDLFGDLILITYHGNERSNAGGIKTYFSDTDDAIVYWEHVIVKLRLAHGYEEVSV